MSKELEEEVWKDIPEYEGMYQISSHGRLKSLERDTKRGEITLHKKEKILNFYFSSRGYYCVKLYYGNRKFKNFSIHKLVANAFIPNPNNYPQINHIDGNRQNNYYKNLEWCTISMNTQYAYDNGLKDPKNYMGEACVTSKLKDEEVISIREKSKQGYSYKELSEEFNVVQGTIGFIVKNQSWKHLLNQQ